MRAGFHQPPEKDWEETLYVWQCFLKEISAAAFALADISILYKFDKTMLFPLITITIVPFSAVCNRRHAKMLTKELSKVTAGAKAAVVGDLRNRLIGFC